MNVTQTDRGFEQIEHPKYPPDGSLFRLVQESSAIGDYDNAFDIPGSSYLWIGDHHHLSREEVAELVEHLQSWLKDGDLK